MKPGELQPKIREVLASISDVTAKEIATLIPDVTEHSVRQAARAMVNKGEVLKTVRPRPGIRGVEYQYYLNPNPPSRRPMKLKSPTANGLTARLDELQAQVAELEAWKQNALARHPDLAVDPVILRARAIVSQKLREHNDFAGAERAIAGTLDDKPIMWATVAALEA
jgi:hypothetical protein